MNGVAFTFDGCLVEVAPGQTVLEAARRLGIDLPTLCYLECCGPLTSCLVCVVKVKLDGQDRLVPACATPVRAGMIVESETPEVRAARRTALELLLSDHAGDCLAPCHRICPLGLNIPRMIRQIQAQQLAEAAVTLRTAVALPAVLGRLCHHPCESGCRRADCDSAAAIRELERYVADHRLGQPEENGSPSKPTSGQSVAIVGAGPAGLSAAFYLLREGHACDLFDRRREPGGSLRAVDRRLLPPAVLEAEVGLLQRLGARFHPDAELGRGLSLHELAAAFDAVLLTLGQVTPAEAAALGLASTATGIKVGVETFQTNVEKVFAAGSAVRPAKLLVRAMSEGQAAAHCVDAFLLGRDLGVAGRPFSSVLGRLEPGELEAFLMGASPAGRVEPAGGSGAGFTAAEAVEEAKRCLRCDCRAAEECKLRHYAARYEARPKRFACPRRLFERQARDGAVVFEPGKCIVCGICVELTRRAADPVGLTFVGRGYDVRVAAPLNRPFADGVQKVVAECVANCPTGALTFADSSVTHP